MNPLDIAKELESGLAGQRTGITTDSIDFFTALSGNPQLEILLKSDTVTVEILENGSIQKHEAWWGHTDVFFSFKNIDDDDRLELIAAYPAGDGLCHWCAQSWAVVVFEFRGGKLSRDPDISMLWIPSQRGWGLGSVHGYSFQPVMGEILHFLAPSWLNMPSGDVGEVKGRTVSAIIDTLLRSSHKR